MIRVIYKQSEIGNIHNVIYAGYIRPADVIGYEITETQEEWTVAEYDLTTGTVVNTSLEMITPSEGCGICISNGFAVGDEELNFITIQDVDAETLELKSACQVLAPPSMTFTLRENKRLKALTEQQSQQIVLMQSALDDLILNSGGGI